MRFLSNSKFNTQNSKLIFIVMDEKDRRILNLLQREFPLCEEPFRAIAERVGLDEGEVLDRVRRLKRDGIIRRIGAVFDPKKLGYVSTLCAAKVPDENIPAFVEAVNAYPGVTHNYRRDHEYNIWFTFIAPDPASLERSLEEIRRKTGIADILSMPATRTFKINATFDL